MSSTAPHANWTVEAAYARFLTQLEYLQSIDITSNEAETRLKAINRLMFEILDWDVTDVEVEKYCRTVGYADYVFSIRRAFALVIEAKRAEESFVIPEAKFKPEPVCFALIEAESPTAGVALRQALGYAASLGARYVAITNGHQWILSLTYVQSQTVEERQVIIFDSLSAIKENFREFWRSFSKHAITTNEILPLLMESRKKPAPPKPSTAIAGYPVPSNRNRFVNELSYFLNIVWDVLSRTENTQTFLDACYVAPAANEHLITFAKDLLKRRIAADKLFTQSEVADAKPDTLHSTIIGYENEKPFVILGDVGHGKTTFLNYLRLVAAKDLFNNYIQLETNFLDRPDSDAEVNDFVYKEIEHQLLERYNIDIFEDSIVRGALHLELLRFRNSSRYKLAASEQDKKQAESSFIHEQLNDRHAYFRSVVRHLKRGRNQSLAIFFDNLDRRDASIQESAFLKASSIARDWECIVFICLRPTTFYTSLKRGLLDSLAPKTFTVGSPDLPLILKRRFQFAEKLAVGEVDTPILQDAIKSREISFKLPGVSKFFACCEFSAFKGSNAINMLAALSNGNIRVLLELTKRTIVSGHLDTEKIVKEINRTGTYYVPDFEAVKTLLYGDYDHYDPKYSLFVNIFDIYHTDEKEHFLRLLVLDYLNRFNDHTGGRSWVPYQEILSYLESFYFDVATIQRHLKVLVESECIDGETGTIKDNALGTKLRISTRGAYHIANLISEFQYIDAVTIDTPILDAELRERVRHAVHIDERIDRTRSFLAYLTQCADALIDNEGRATTIRILQMAFTECKLVEQRVRARSPQRNAR